MTTVLAHFDGKVLVPEEPVAIETGARLRLTIEVVQTAQSAVTPAPRRFQPLDIQIAPELSHAIAMAPEFNIEES